MHGLSVAKLSLCSVNERRGAQDELRGVVDNGVGPLRGVELQKTKGGEERRGKERKGEERKGKERKGEERKKQGRKKQTEQERRDARQEREESKCG